MKSAAKNTLLHLIRESMPFDEAQKVAAEEGVERLGDLEAHGATENLENAFRQLPHVLDKLEAELSKAERKRKNVRVKKRLMTVEEVANFLRVHPSTIRRMLKRGDIRPLKKEGGTLRFDQVFIERFKDRYKGKN